MIDFEILIMGGKKRHCDVDNKLSGDHCPELKEHTCVGMERVKGGEKLVGSWKQDILQ